MTEAMAEVADLEVVDVVDTEVHAVQAIKGCRLDIVLLDLHLKQGTGFGVLRAVCGMPDCPMIIVLTNHDLPEYHDAALALGAAEFLDKAQAFACLPQLLSERVQLL